MCADNTELKKAGERVGESEDKLSQIVYSTPIPTFVIDKKKIITHWNRACEKLTGFSAEEMCGTKKQWKAFYAEKRPVMADLVLEKNPEGELERYYPGGWKKSDLVKGAYEAEGFFRDVGNSGKWIFFTAAPLLDSVGNITGAIETIQDITEQKQAERALRESEANYRNLVETASSGCWQVDPQEITVDVNKALCDMLSYSREEIIGKTPMDFVDEDNEPIFRENIAKNSNRIKRSYEISLIRKDGEKVYAKFNSTTLFDSSGEVTGSFAFVTDLSERKRMEEALRESEKRYKHEKEYLDNIFENSADAIAIVDKHGRFTRWNKRAAEMFGYSFEEMQGKHFSEFYADQHKLEKMIADLKTNGFVYAYEIDFINRDGSLRPCSISISIPRDEENKPIGSISIVRDLSEWKEAQQKLQEMSFYDALTKLYNRFFFEEEMERIGDVRHLPVGIIICDVDGLKLINDTMGHNKGDELLKATARILKNCFRRSDIIARIGGDEFAILLPRSDEKTVQDCCVRIKEQVEDYNLGNPELDLSLSVGHAVKNQPPVNMKVLFKKADDAMYKEKLQQRHSSHNAAVGALFKTLEAKDHVSEGHTRRLQNYVEELGETLRLSEERLNLLRLLARFHDLGKVGVADQILFKPGPLSPSEYQEMKRHCEIGHRIALSTRELAPIADFILKHHEWWNGQGYPLGLKEKEIPLECRILAIADAFDEMISERPYRLKPKSYQEAIEEVRRCSGIQFDPELVDVFIRIASRDRD